MGEPLWTLGGVAISDVARDQSMPTIASDGAGGAILTWVDDRSCCFNPDIYAQRIDASGTVLWTADGVPICTAAKEQIAPQVVADDAGGAIVVWEDGRIGGTNRDVFAQRIDVSGAVQWAANGVALCTAPNNQYLPKIVSDDAGGAIATWVDFRTAGVSDIYAQRIDPSGAVQWTANGVKLSGPLSSEYSPVIVADGAGGAIVSWQDFRTGSGDVFVQRVNSSGTPQWTPDGVFISAARWDVNGGMASDGAGGAIVSWHSFEDDGFEYDLFVQHVNASGAVQWPADGITISAADGSQHASTMIPDGAGGAMIAWEDSSYALSTNFDIRAQRVDGAGVVQWTPGGVSVCSADNEQRRPAIIPDAAGGAIASWEDFRNGTNTDIFALQIGSDGSIPTGVGDTPPGSTIALTANYPNPFSAETRMNLGLAADADVVVDVFDVAGRRVRHMDFGRLSAGPSALSFDGLGDHGRRLPNGVYFYRVSANGAMVTRKLVIAR